MALSTDNNNTGKKENEVELHRAEMRMIRWMSGVKLKDRQSSVVLRQQLGIEDTVKGPKK